MKVVLTDAVLPDGDWRRVLEIVAHNCPNIGVVVSSRLGDYKLWIDLLEQGAYDVLVEPYEPQEVRRIVEAAAGRQKVCALLASRPSYKLHKAARAAGAA